MTAAVASGDVNLRGNALSRELEAGSSGDEADGENNVEEAEGDPDQERSDENDHDDVDQENTEEGSDENYSYLYGNITQGNFTYDDIYQVSDSNNNGGGSWMYYFMLNALKAPLDAVGHGDCCKTHPPPRCRFPHMGPLSHKDSHTSSNTCNNSGDTGGGARCYIWNRCFWSGITSNGSGSGGDSGIKEQYEQYLGNGHGGNVQQVNGSKGLNVWGFLIAALIAGVVSAALMAFKKVSMYGFLMNLQIFLRILLSFSQIYFPYMHSFNTIEA